MTGSTGFAKLKNHQLRRGYGNERRDVADPGVALVGPVAVLQVLQQARRREARERDAIRSGTSKKNIGSSYSSRSQKNKKFPCNVFFSK